MTKEEVIKEHIDKHGLPQDEPTIIACLEAYDLGAQQERNRIKNIILENSYEVYSGANGFLQTNTDKVMLALSDQSQR
jgi:hypothetical protein